MDIRSALREAQQQLALAIQSADSISLRLEAEVLLAHSLGKQRSYLFTWPEHELNANEQQQFMTLLQQRLQGQPIAYILGYRAFWGMNLNVSSATLIPRPETELLVELALTKLAPDQNAQVLDLGTGSGAIALAIAKERPQAKILATDYSTEALAIAQVNAQQQALHQVEFKHSHWFDKLAPHAHFTVIVSNPPYIAEHDSHLSQGDLRFEPSLALSSGTDGLNAIRHIIQHAPTYLQAGGYLLLEHGFDQGVAVCNLLRQADFQQVQCHADLAGHDRVSSGQWLPTST